MYQPPGMYRHFATLVKRLIAYIVVICAIGSVFWLWSLAARVL